MRTNSEQETFEFGKRLALEGKIHAGNVVLLLGELGAGKTVIVRGICEGLGVNSDDVHSPTFAIVNEYAARDGLVVYHFDAYRLSGEDWQQGGFDEYVGDGSVCLVEWAQNVNADGMKIKIEGSGADERCIYLE